MERARVCQRVHIQHSRHPRSGCKSSSGFLFLFRLPACVLLNSRMLRALAGPIASHLSELTASPPIRSGSSSSTSARERLAPVQARGPSKRRWTPERRIMGEGRGESPGADCLRPTRECTYLKPCSCRRVLTCLKLQCVEIGRKRQNNNNAV